MEIGHGNLWTLLWHISMYCFSYVFQNKRKEILLLITRTLGVAMWTKTSKALPRRAQRSWLTAALSQLMGNNLLTVSAVPSSAPCLLGWYCWAQGGVLSRKSSPFIPSKNTQAKKRPLFEGFNTRSLRWSLRHVPQVMKNVVGGPQLQV